MIILALALYTLSFLLVWQFVGYPLFMGLVALRARPGTKNSAFTPFVSIVVPAFNEIAVLEQRIENLLALDYPDDQYEILVVESGSTDGTGGIVERLVKSRNGRHPEIRLLRETDRQGKASAINLGKRHSRGEIVLVTDANSQFEPNVLREMMPHFEDPTVGAVGGRYLVSNPENVYTASESFYWDLEYIMRCGEAALDSACLFHGEINAWRKDLVPEADTGIISEDLEMAIRIRRQGYKIEYEPRARVYEPTAATAKGQIVRRRKVSTGTILCIFKHLRYFLLPRDLYSLLIFPSHKGLTMLSPFLLLAILLLYLAARDPLLVVAHLASTAVVFALLLGALLALWPKLIPGGPGRTRIGLGSLAKIAYYVLLNEYLVFMAWIDFFSGRHTVLWERVESTRRPAEQ